MSTSIHEDNDFIAFVISNTLLEDAISWINDNLEPEDVFDESKLRDWASSMGLEEEE